MQLILFIRRLIGRREIAAIKSEIRGLLPAALSDNQSAAAVRVRQLGRRLSYLYGLD
jgi:hypothetical protein